MGAISLLPTIRSSGVAKRRCAGNYFQPTSGMYCDQFSFKLKLKDVSPKYIPPRALFYGMTYIKLLKLLFASGEMAFG